MKKPKLICLTPVCNNAWCLHAFLECNSTRADHIIIADQHSTDGSREIAKQFPKVILVDNNDDDFNESSRQQLLVSTAQKIIEGDKVLIALDSDEIFTANYTQTDDWQKIINAKRGDVFVFKWATLDTTGTKYDISSSGGWQQWGVFDDGTQQYLSGKIHVARVPWPQNSTTINEVFIKDFNVIHLSALNTNNNIIKRKYYQMFISINKDPRFKWNAISAFRGYTDINDTENYDKYISVPEYFFENYKKQNIDVLELIDKNPESNPVYDKRILEYFNKYGVSFFRKLDVFDAAYLHKLSKIASKEIKDPRKWTDKLVHFYLRKTQKIRRNIFVRIIDKILKKIY